MKNRLVLWIAAVVMGLATLIVSAEIVNAVEYMEGVEYTRINKPLRTVSEAGKIEVREYFWYGCPHCFRMEPFMERWLDTNPKNIIFKLQPTIFRDDWMPAAQAFYTAQALGIEGKMHPELLDAIHQRGEKALLSDARALELFFKKHGVKPTDFRKSWNSFSVGSQVKQALRITKQSGIHGVPAVIVNGKYVTNPVLAGGYDSMFKVIEFLVARSLSENRGR